MSTYTQMRYIAYQVPTVVREPFANIANPPPPRYFEMPDSDVAVGSPANKLMADGFMKPEIININNSDAKERVSRLYLVMIQAASELLNLNDDRNTLKVFVVPEFYFRPLSSSTTVGSAYTYQNYKEIKLALKAIASEGRFKDWLIIPGTIMWYGNQTMGKRPATTDNIYFNTCPYYKVGTFNVQTHVIEKEQSSPIDGLPTGHHGPPPIGPPTARATDEVWSIYQTRAKKEKHVIEHFGVNCGVEICLEHLRGLLKDLLSDLTNWQVGTVRKVRKSISLQIITSGGMTIYNSNVAVVNNGFILRNDGLGTNGVLGGDSQVQIKKVLSYTNKDFGNGVAVTYGSKPGFAEYDNAITITIPTVVDHPLTGALVVPRPTVPFENAYYFGQRILIYERVPLP